MSRVKVGKDAVSRIARRLKEDQREWRERPLEEKTYPYLYLDATYLKVRWGASVTSMALLACVVGLLHFGGHSIATLPQPPPL